MTNPGKESARKVKGKRRRTAAALAEEVQQFHQRHATDAPNHVSPFLRLLRGLRVDSNVRAFSKRLREKRMIPMQRVADGRQEWVASPGSMVDILELEVRDDRGSRTALPPFNAQAIMDLLTRNGATRDQIRRAEEALVHLVAGDVSRPSAPRAQNGLLRAPPAHVPAPSAAAASASPYKPMEDPLAYDESFCGCKDCGSLRITDVFQALIHNPTTHPSLLHALRDAVLTYRKLKTPDSAPDCRFNPGPPDSESTEEEEGEREASVEHEDDPTHHDVTLQRVLRSAAAAQGRGNNTTPARSHGAAAVAAPVASPMGSDYSENADETADMWGASSGHTEMSVGLPPATMVVAAASAAPPLRQPQRPTAPVRARSHLTEMMGPFVMDEPRETARPRPSEFDSHTVSPAQFFGEQMATQEQRPAPGKMRRDDRDRERRRDHPYGAPRTYSVGA